MPSPRVIAPTFSRSSRIPENVVSDFHLQPNRLIADFSKFKLFPICLRGEFNNHFKDQQHFCTVAAIISKASRAGFLRSASAVRHRRDRALLDHQPDR